MGEATKLNRALREAYKKYKEAKVKLESSADDPALFQAAAQQVNDAWLEFKKANVAASNYTMNKNLGDLYG